MFKEIEPERINWPCGRFLSKDFIDAGFDSNVFMYDGKYVVKVYKQESYGLSRFSELRRQIFYSSLMNKGAELVNKNKMTLIFPKSKKEFVLKINPVIGVRKCKNCNLIESLSLYVAGANLLTFTNTNRLDYREISTVFSETDVLLNERLGVEGIRLIPLNVKKIDEKTLVVTDLCPDIKILREI